MPDSIWIGDPAIEVRLRRNARAKRMILRAPRHGNGVFLTLPPRASLRNARSFLTDNEQWLRRQIETAPLTKVVGDGIELPFEGRMLTLRSDDGRGTRIVDGELRVAGTPDVIAVRTRAFLRHAARERLLAAVTHYSGLVERKHGRMSLRDTRSRWGSCTSTGDLMFSWRLVMAPRPVLDYVAAHEVAHLVEMNHSPRFWALVRSICPGFDEPRQWLRQKGAGLHAYDFSAS